MSHPRTGYLSASELSTLGFAHLGADVLVDRSALIIGHERLSLGDHVRIDAFATIVASGSVKIGRYVHIAGYCYIGGSGGIEMEDFSGLSHGVKIYSASDTYSGEWMTNPTVPSDLTKVEVAPVRLGRHVIVGAGSVILPGSTLAEGAAVGSLSVVKGELAPWTIFGGSPARPLKPRSRRALELEQKLR